MFISDCVCVCTISNQKTVSSSTKITFEIYYKRWTNAKYPSPIIFTTKYLCFISWNIDGKSTSLIYNIQSNIYLFLIRRGLRGRDRMVVGLQLPMQSVHNTTEVNSSKSTLYGVYSIQYYVIKFVSDLRPVRGFIRVHWIPPPIKLTATLKMSLNTIPITLSLILY